MLSIGDGVQVAFRRATLGLLLVTGGISIATGVAALG
jgi:hypothetical protein